MPTTQDNTLTLGPMPKSLRSPGVWFDAGKRAFDVSAALLGLALLSPVMLASMAWIRVTDGGPIFYEQWRVGQDGWLFRIWKLRTMRQQAEAEGARFASSDDDRVLPGCHWMRKSHVDELPQLWNILRGEMSLVGPRPERPEIIEQMRQRVPGIDLRLATKPGLTGLAQVHNGYANDLTGMRRKLAADLRYLRKRSLLGDLRLVLQTIPKFWDQAAC